MDCSSVRRKLAAFADGELSPEGKERVCRHLESCPECRRDLEQLRAAGAELDRITDVEVRPYFATRVKQRIADRQAKRAVVGWFPRAAIPVAAAAVLFLTVLTGSFLGRTLYGWRAAGAASGRRATSAGSVLFDESSEGTLGQLTDNLFAGGARE